MGFATPHRYNKFNFSIRDVESRNRCLKQRVSNT